MILVVRAGEADGADDQVKAAFLGATTFSFPRCPDTRLDDYLYWPRTVH
jgi:hypothetical protein